MFKKNAATLVAGLIIGAILLAQALSYFAVPYRYDASADITATGVEYEMSTNASVTYTVLAFDGANEIKNLYIYYDEGYAVHGTSYNKQKEFITGVMTELRIRSFPGNIEVADAARLGEIVQTPGAGDAILMTSGALPSTVYSDTNNDIFDWTGSGGTLYWMGYAIGAKFAEKNVLKDIGGDYQDRIFGVGDCILLPTESKTASERSSDKGDLSRALMLTHNAVTFGLDIERIRSAGGAAASLGFDLEEGGRTYSSISLVEKGSGMICVLGSSFGDKARVSVSQLMATGVTYSSELLAETVSGSLVRETKTGEMTWDKIPDGTVSVQIRMGEPTLIYAATLFL